jgi:aspartyl/asparaginyl-tRNA synthetase
MGVERFIAWILGLSDIKDTILYPRLKNIKMYP